MARIELRNCTVRMKDGLAGTAEVNQPTTAPASGDATLTVNDVVLNTTDTEKIPIGARFKIAGETAPTVHVVTGRTPSADAPTTAITFAPALGTGTYANAAVLTFQSQEIEIKIGDGDIKYTEANEYKYDKDRGRLDTVREGDDVPMEVSMNFTFEHIKSGTGEAITPIDALKRINAASEWVTSSNDPCEPYSVDIEIENVPPCGDAGAETILFPDFRSEKRDFDIKNANIAVSGKCNAVEPIITRAA